MSIQVETLVHMEAFEYYYSLGLNRSYDLVAEHMGIAKQSVAKWGKSFKWRERVMTRDLEAGKKLRERNNTSLLDEKDEYRKIIKASLGSYVQELKAGRVKVNKVNDVINLIKLDLELQGLGENKDSLSEETTNTIAQLMQSIRDVVENENIGDGEYDDEEDGATK